MAIPWCNIGSVWRVLENFPLELFARPISSSSCRLILPFLINWHHSPTLSSLVAPLRYTSKLCLWIFTKRIILAFKNPRPLLNFRSRGFSIFVFAFNDYNEWARKLWYGTERYAQKTIGLHRKWASPLRGRYSREFLTSCTLHIHGELELLFQSFLNLALGKCVRSATRPSLSIP